MHGRPYPSDVSDDEWEFVAPYLSVLPQTAAHGRHDLREVFSAVRSIVRTGAPGRWWPTNFPPWEAVDQQMHRWIAAGCFEAIVHDLRLLVRAAGGLRPQPSAAIVDSRTLRSTVESGPRAGVDGHKWVRGSKVRAVVDTMGTLLALAVTPANEAERRHARQPAESRPRRPRPSRRSPTRHPRGAGRTRRAGDPSRLGCWSGVEAPPQHAAAPVAALRVCLPAPALAPPGAVSQVQAVQTGLAALDSLVNTFRLALPT